MLIGVYAYLLLLCIVCWVTGYTLGGGTWVYAGGMIGMILCAAVALRISYCLFLMRERTLLPLLLCMLLLSTGQAFIPLERGGIGRLCIGVWIYTLFSTYHNTGSTRQGYVAGLIVGTGSLFWGYMLWCLPLTGMVMYRFLSLTAKTFVASLLGAGTVYWIVGGFCSLSGDYALLLDPLQAVLQIAPLNWSGIAWVEGCWMAAYTLFAAIAVLCTFGRHYDENRRTQSFYGFLLLYGLLTLLLTALYGHGPAGEIFQCLCIPASIFLADFYTTSRSGWRRWAFHAMMMALLALYLMAMIAQWNLL
ncbi:MAG: hypothetical protein LBU08_01055 [Tannerellaceae bacterium]|jgi:hypothetical protein|nr:hypothetical protein [Tannerellaceae bacterium]